MQFSPHIFKAYDIRGTCGFNLDNTVAHAIGRGFARLMQQAGQSHVVIGRDGRLSSPALSAALCAGLQDADMQVLDIGMVTTPMLYFACHTLKDIQCGIMVTGSHNPPEDNGFKMLLCRQALYGLAIEKLAQIVSTLLPRPLSDGRATTHQIEAAYYRRITTEISLTRPIKIVVDAGNGVAGQFAPALYRALGCTVHPLFCEVDGQFPHHHPDPAQPKNLQALIQTVQSTGAELGLAFDGDGDRLGVVTATGEIIHPDQLLMLFAQHVLADIKNSSAPPSVVYDVKCTRHLAPWIKQHGGLPVLWNTGHSLIKAKMREITAVLGGEMSGHFFFHDRWYGFDDGLYAGARLLEILSCYPESQAVFAALPKLLATPELHIPCAAGEAKACIEKLQQAATEFFSKAQHIFTQDGVRAEYADGFGLARASNTSSVIVLRFEGDTKQSLYRIHDIFKHAILQLDPNAAWPSDLGL